LLEIAKTNQKPKPIDLMQKIRKVGKRLNEEKSEDKKNAILLFIKKRGLRKNMLLVTSSWISCFVAYGGIHLNIYNFHGNQFVNFFILAIIELPSYLIAWYCMETRLGRRWSNAMFSVLCGISLCIPVILPHSYTTLTNLVTLVGKFCVSASFMIIYQQASEIYPTPIRNQGMGIGSMASSIISLILPYLAYLVRIIFRNF
jgi:OCT family organic cation transporter-like MFS transporter 4/5